MPPLAQWDGVFVLLRTIRGLPYDYAAGYSSVRFMAIHVHGLMCFGSLNHMWHGEGLVDGSNNQHVAYGEAQASSCCGIMLMICMNVHDNPNPEFQ